MDKDIAKLKESICEGKEVIIGLGFSSDEANEFYAELDSIAYGLGRTWTYKEIEAEAMRRIIDA